MISHWSANINEHFICCCQIRKLSPLLSSNIPIHLSGAILTTSGGIWLSGLLHKGDFRVSICTFRLKRNAVIYKLRLLLNWTNLRHFTLPGIFFYFIWITSVYSTTYLQLFQRLCTVKQVFCTSELHVWWLPTMRIPYLLCPTQNVLHSLLKKNLICLLIALKI